MLTIYGLVKINVAKRIRSDSLESLSCKVVRFTFCTIIGDWTNGVRGFHSFNFVCLIVFCLLFDT